ncbi:MAG: hypothetical protein ACLGSD_15695 [Acidobacteriota bacterium]
MRSTATALLCVTLFAPFIPAQQSNAKSTGVTVSGRVFLEDTNAPARLATVTLQQANAVDALRADKEEVPSQSQSVQTLLDGSFSIPNVAPGAYYVLATETGYISPMSTLIAAKSDRMPDDAARNRLAALAPRIVVQGNLPASVNITLERGGTVSGTVLYDDGSPAAGLRVELLVKKKDDWVTVPQVGLEETISSGYTDDRGYYRISGLPGQEYAVSVHMNLMNGFWFTTPGRGSSGSTSSAYSFTVYSGNHMRRKDAEGFELKPGDEHGGEDIQIPVSQLHTVRGTVTAARDGHIVNGGRVALRYPDDNSDLAATSVASDGSFNFSFVPEGDFLLHVTNAADTDYIEKPNPNGRMPPTITESHVTHKYGVADVPIHVAGDVSGFVAAVPEDKTAASGNQ